MIRLGFLMLALLAVGCETEAQEHFRKTARIGCATKKACEPELFHALYDDIQHCTDAAAVGVGLYADTCEDFDDERARKCRKILRRSRDECRVDTSEPSYEASCIEVCSNYQTGWVAD